METITILLVEDQTLMRQGLSTILDLEEGMRVVGEATNGEEGVRMALQLKPEIILMDVQMPKVSGVEATQAIVAAWPQAKVIVLTTFDRDDYVFQSIRAGAMGYLLKDTPAENLISTIRRVHAGDAFIQPEIASRALREIAHLGASGRTPLPDTPFDLSDREREVLVLLAQGASNRDIAEKLFITEGTVKNHVSNILGKLQAENRTQAADIARRYGLTQL
jgi:DNA-binding NarL/FixJ family response regulator